jgi:hypothetical protein
VVGNIEQHTAPQDCQLWRKGELGSTGQSAHHKTGRGSLRNIVLVDHSDLGTAAAQNIGSRDSSRWLADDQNNSLRSAVGKCVANRSRSCTGSHNPGNLCMNPSIIESALDSLGVGVGHHRADASERHRVGNAQQINNGVMVGNQWQNRFLQWHSQ